MHDNGNTQPKVYGMIAEFDDPDALLAAAKRAYSEGYRSMEAYSPLPIHGLAEAIGFTKNYVPHITLVAGLAGAAGGFFMQYFASVIHYPYDIAGRRYLSWPAFIPITFESMILIASFTCGIGMLLMNGFPRPHHPVMNAKNFERATSDRFFLCIESDDPKYDAAKIFLDGLSPKPLEVSEVEES